MTPVVSIIMGSTSDLPVMKKAAKLILEGNLSIAEISDQTGFGTQSHFSTAFKKYFGVSPKDYKEKWKEEHKRSHAK